MLRRQPHPAPPPLALHVRLGLARDVERGAEGRAARLDGLFRQRGFGRGEEGGGVARGYAGAAVVSRGGV
jgi:hypothetical protein